MDKQTVYDVIVIGAGPAGMMAAGQAAAQGGKTLLLEKTDKPGKKLSITGQKRCNLTNTADLNSFIAHFGREGQFLRQAFHRFFKPELLEFMGSIGISTEVERGGRIFPASGDASQVTEHLMRWCRDASVEFRTNAAVADIIIENGRTVGVMLRNGNIVNGTSIILCTGGATYPGTGSTGDGFAIAKSIGHTVVPIRPALVPLKTYGNFAKKLQGLPLRNVSVSIFNDGKLVQKDFGEMLFTHFGVSGPVILTHSGGIVDAIEGGKEVKISIDLKPALDERKLDQRLRRELGRGGKQYIRTMLKRVLPIRLIPVCLEICSIPFDKPCHQITAEERKRLVGLLKNFEITIQGPLSLESGMVTMGGISLKEVYPRTMMSKMINGVFFAGEVLDLAGDTGGYNLQAAFSTGWLAGRSAAEFSSASE